MRRRKKRWSIFKIIRLLKTFKVKNVSCSIDTGDFTLNAKLYPVFMLFNHHFGNFSINFEGRNHLQLHIQNRPIYLINYFINR